VNNAMANNSAKPSNPLPRVAFFSFTSCEGCQLAVLSCEDELPDILRSISLVYFREAMTERNWAFDIAFVEGSVTTPREEKKLRRVRAKAKIVIALGACSTTGGLNCLKNRYKMDLVKKAVYGKGVEKNKIFDTMPARPIDSVIHVDFYLHGCPISKKEFISTLKLLLIGAVPRVPNHPVCVDCKMAGNICVFEKGMTCLGPVTRAGCDAICVTYGAICWGCRGAVDNPNTASHGETLKRYGLTAESIGRKFGLYGAYAAGKADTAKK
jgi:coenzyme F420-reducing hydrogenase gamma subunit